MKYILFFLCCVLLPLRVVAVNTERLQELQELNISIDKANDNEVKLKKMETILDKFSRQRKLDCELAFGDVRFCDCLNQKLPISLDFKMYVQLITSDKKELLNKMNPEDKKMTDIVYQARDTCVSMYLKS